MPDDREDATSGQPSIQPRLPIRQPRVTEVPSDTERQRHALTAKEYLLASTEAANRTRYVTITMVVASMLITIAALNSMRAWSEHRAQATARSTGKYLESKLGPRPAAAEQQKDYDRRYAVLSEALLKSYVDNTFPLHVPFLGLSFDVNDLGSIGGTALLAILVMMLVCLKRERENLWLSFRDVHPSELQTFYTLLAMRQVFTIPRSPVSKGRSIAAVVTKLLWLMPLAAHTFAAWHDDKTLWVFTELGAPARQIFVCEYTIGGFILVLTIGVLWLLWSIDAAWDHFYHALGDLESGHSYVE